MHSPPGILLYLIQTELTDPGWKHISDSFLAAISSGSSVCLWILKIWVFLVDLWWVSCTELQENLDVISWQVSCSSTDSEERWQDVLTATVTGVAWVTAVTPSLTGVQVHHLQQAGSWLLVRVPGKGETCGGTLRFTQQNRWAGKSTSNYPSH